MMKQRDSAAREILGSAQTSENGHFDNEVSAGEKRGASPEKLAVDCRGPALYEVTAHDDRDEIGSGPASCLFNLIFMAIVEWIVFCNDGSCFHSRSPQLVQIICLHSLSNIIVETKS